jgi:hypothetical protein
MSDVLREVRVVRCGVTTTDPPSPGPRLVACEAVGVDGSKISLPIKGVEYEHDAAGSGVVKLALYADHVVFPVEGRDV